MYDRRWYLCEIREADEAAMPDFSRVPELKRAEVEARWRSRNATVSRWYLWGPQIEAYARMPGVFIVVLETAH